MPPTILLANTWAPHAVAQEAVPAYLCAFVAALVGAGAPLRLLVRRAEDARALRAAIPALADTRAWEAAVLPRLDDAPGAARVVAAVDVLFWADDARALTLARHGAALLKAAAHARVRRVVYRAQLTSRHARRDFEDALDLLDKYHTDTGLAHTAVAATPLFTHPVARGGAGETLAFALGARSHASLASLAAAEAALLRPGGPPAHFDLVSRHCADAGIGNTYFAPPARRRSVSLGAVGGLSRRRALADDDRLHEAWLTYLPAARGRTRPRLSLLTCLCCTTGAPSSGSDDDDAHGSTTLVAPEPPKSIEEEACSEKAPAPASPRKPEALASVEFLRAGPWRLELGGR